MEGLGIAKILNVMTLRVEFLFLAGALHLRALALQRMLMNNALYNRVSPVEVSQALHFHLSMRLVDSE